MSSRGQASGVRAKLQQIEILIVQIRKDIETWEQESPRQTGRRRPVEQVPPQEELRALYDKLYGNLVSSKGETIGNVLKGKSKTYLRAFCRANNIPVDTTKVAKPKVVDEIEQWLAQRKAIRMKAISQGGRG